MAAGGTPRWALHPTALAAGVRQWRRPAGPGPGNPPDHRIEPGDFVSAGHQQSTRFLLRSRDGGELQTGRQQQRSQALSRRQIGPDDLGARDDPAVTAATVDRIADHGRDARAGDTRFGNPASPARDFAMWLDVTFVPYGIRKSRWSGNLTTYVFTCPSPVGAWSDGIVAGGGRDEHRPAGPGRTVRVPAPGAVLLRGRAAGSEHGRTRTASATWPGRMPSAPT